MEKRTLTEVQRDECRIALDQAIEMYHTKLAAQHRAWKASEMGMKMSQMRPDGSYRLYKEFGHIADYWFQFMAGVADVINDRNPVNRLVEDMGTDNSKEDWAFGAGYHDGYMSGSTAVLFGPPPSSDGELIESEV